MKSIIQCIFVLVFLFINTTPIQALPITSQSDLNPLDIVIDFENLPRGYTSNPLSISEATFSSASSMQIALNTYAAASTYPTFTSGNYLMSPQLGRASVPITISFSQPVSEFGVGIFDPNFTGNSLRVYNSDGVLLESVECVAGEIGGSFSDFIGVIRPSYEIAFVQIVPAIGDFIGIDNVTFSSISTTTPPTPDDPDDPPVNVPDDPSPAPVPEPATIALLGIGLLGAFYTKSKQ